MSLITWGDATRETLADARASIAVLPVGAVEQHGPHLPTRADAEIVAELAGRAARTAAREVDVVLLPTLPFGSSDHHLPFGGTLSLTAETFVAVLRDLLRSIASAGFRRVLVVNGHGGNVELCAVAVRQAALEHGLLAATASYWELFDPEPGIGPVPGHAGAFETSLMLTLDGPGLRMDRARSSPGPADHGGPRGIVLEEPGGWARIDGFTDDPRAASAEVGERALAAAASALAEAIVGLARRSAFVP